MRLSLLLFSLVFFSGCDRTETSQIQAQTTEPQRVEVQHILIAFEGSLPGRDLDRSLDKARELAKKVEAKAKHEKDFEALVRAYSDDQIPGIYRLANSGLKPKTDEFARQKMVQAFGDLAFSLKPGEVGMTEFHPTNSPYGFHIIKRLK